ncbi:uncharacterized protein SOCE26_063890 [Sorangium cellulosum]|uniref:DNRLRE domain-containing protein n=1 Tax=Sorangium cellulosum TaxID=56 RepID=A0A2L0F0B8_SORCE|nr:DNRLRE domain-containing protein [Sorangium cellulosum]AUX44919.1 uncharacterized protein SOCE26_063890 [Sorangium cellulosum]
MRIRENPSPGSRLLEHLDRPSPRRWAAPRGALLIAMTVGAACSPGSPEEGPLGTAKLAANGDGTTCVTIQRGTLGTVEDATIWEVFPTWTDSTVSFRTGLRPGFGIRHAVLRFDLSPVPAGATVVSSTLNLRQIYRDDTSSSTINIHRITSPWSESTVTWQSLGNGSDFDPAIAASFQSLPGAGARSADLTALTAAWLAGTASNYGMLLEEAPVLTTEFHSGEEPQIDKRPSLEVCYTESPLCSGALDDGDACTADTCDPLLGIQHTPLSTDDSDPSTIDLCDPATGAVTHVACPALDPTVATRLIDAVGCIYQGPDAPQTGITAGAIDPVTVAVVKGKVATRAGVPISGVRVSVLHHDTGAAESYGQVLTRADGAFEMVVRGGQPLTMKYEKPGYLPVQRQVAARWQHWSNAPDVVMIESDPVVTPVTLGSTTEVQVARGSVQSDESGARQATLLFPPGTTGTMTVPDPSGPPGATTTVALPAEVHVRATEYTVGPTGSKAMPAALPPTSGYTYAVELGLDEAVAAGATKVEFSQPIPFYVENFLNFPVGMAVPLGYYDAQKGAWVPADDGRIIEILDVSGGAASVDVDGDGVADGASALAGLGIDSEELEELATLYAAGTSLWRVRVTHFTPWDCNWPFGPPSGAAGPPGPGGDGSGSGPEPGEPEDEPCKEAGSVIECENQILGERLPIAGTPFSLHYQSDRTKGWGDERRLRIPLTSSTVPADLKRIEYTVTFAGRTVESSIECPCEPGRFHDLDWDGIDAHGRKVTGKQPVSVEIGYVYDGVYREPAGGTNARSFGVPSGVSITGSTTRQEVTLWRRWERTLRAAWENASDGLGGWSLSEHHAFDSAASTLYLGNGSRRTGSQAAKMIQRVGGGVARTTATRADGIDALAASIDASGIAVGPDGSIYFSDVHTDRVRKISPSGVVTTVAGIDGSPGYTGDNGPATTARLNNPEHLAFGPEGDLYIYDRGNFRIRRIDASGTIVTVAGNGAQTFSHTVFDGVPATSMPIGENVSPLAVGIDGSLYFASYPSRASFAGACVRQVGPDGIFRTIAGTGNWGSGGDGGPAKQAEFTYIAGVAVAPDGTVYVADSSNNRVRRIDTSGIITTVAGNGFSSETGDGGPASAAGVGNPRVLTFAPDGSLYVAVSGQQDSITHAILIRRIDPNGVITTVAGRPGSQPASCPLCGFGSPPTSVAIKVPNALAVGSTGELLLGYTDASQFTAKGAITSIRAALPGLSVNDIVVASRDGRDVYGFDEQGRHLVTRDAALGVPRYQFAYDSAGRLRTITDVDGQVTTIQRDGSGAATAIVAPTGQVTTLDLDAEGYLWKVTNPANETTTLEYYPDTGLLRSLSDARGLQHEFIYDAEGRLTRDTNPADGYKELTRTFTASGHNVTISTAMGRPRSHSIEALPGGGTRRVHTGTDGLSTVTEIGTNGVATTTRPDGTVISTQTSGDSRFSMQLPIISRETTTTPLGRTMVVDRSRSVVLAAQNDPLSLTSMTDLMTINGKTFSQTFDKATRTLTSASPAGRQFTVTLTPQGRIQRVAIPMILPVEFTYYPDGRLHTRSQGSRAWIYTYEDNGWLTTMTDSLFNTTSFLHDQVGRVTSTTRGDDEVVGTSYYPGGLVHTLTPPGRPAHSFVYNEADLLEQYVSPGVGGEPRESSWSYDLDRLLTSSNRPGEAATVFTWSPSSSRLNQVTLPMAMGTLTYTYHPTTGNLVGVTGPSGISLSLAYDGSLLTDRTWTGAGFGGGSATVHWTYDNSLRINGEAINGGAALSFGYDDDGFLNQAGGLTLTWHPQNGRYTGSSIGVVSDTVGLDAYGDAGTYVAQVGGTAVYEVSYTPDDRGRIDARTETLLGETHTYEYDYDLAGRLTDVRRDGVLAAHYDYDANGNRLARTSPAGTESGAYDDQDRILSYGDNTYDTTPAGDVVGVTHTSTNVTSTFTYDARGNLRQAVLGNGDVIEYLVDGEHHRVWKKKNGVLVQGFLYRDELRPVAELNGAGAVVARFVYGQERNVPDLVIKGAATYRVLTDHRGSPRLLVNTATGAVAQRIDYDEFGRVLQDTNPGFQPFGFAGGLYDLDTKLVRFGARDYDAEIGRWRSKDPILFHGGDSNLYGYVISDPVNLADPSGRGPAEFFECLLSGRPLAECAYEEEQRICNGPAGPYWCVPADEEGAVPPGWLPSIRYPECHIVPPSQIAACCRDSTGYRGEEDDVDEDAICRRAADMDPDTLKKFVAYNYCITESYQAQGF